MPSTENMSVLVLRLKPGPRPVSALSAFLRTLQAAVRETAANDPIGAPMFEQRPGPTLAADFAHDEAATVVSFRFCDSTGAPIESLSSAAFQQFMQGLSATLSAQPQRDLWGTPVFASRSPSHDRERMREVLEDLSRLGNASLECGRRKVELDQGAVWLGGN